MAFHPVRPCWSASDQYFASNSGDAPSQGSHAHTHTPSSKTHIKTKTFIMVHDGSLVHAIKMEYNRSGLPSIGENQLESTQNTYYLRCPMSHFTASIVTSTAKYEKYESHVSSISLTSKSSHTHTHKKTQGLQSSTINLGISNSNFKTCESLTSVISWTCQRESYHGIRC